MESLMDTPRRSYRHNNLPNALRAAARAILDEDGPDVVGLRETARRVGVSATAAYRHFNNKEDLLASVAAEGFRELAAAMEAAAEESDPLRGVGLAYVDFALQKRGLFRLMFGPILVERAKYPGLNAAADSVFNLLQRIAVSADQGTHEDNSAGMAAWGLVHGLSSLFIDGLVPETSARGLASEILVRDAPTGLPTRRLTERSGAAKPSGYSRRRERPAQVDSVLPSTSSEVPVEPQARAPGAFCPTPTTAAATKRRPGAILRKAAPAADLGGKESAGFDHRTAVHHDHHAPGAGAFRRLLIDHAELHPDHAGQGIEASALRPRRPPRRRNCGRRRPCRCAPGRPRGGR